MSKLPIPEKNIGDLFQADECNLIVNEINRQYEQASIFNATIEVPLTSGYYTPTTARAAVPSDVKKGGLFLVYLTSTGWVSEQFKGSDVSTEWDLANKWESLLNKSGNLTDENLVKTSSGSVVDAGIKTKSVSDSIIHLINKPMLGDQSTETYYREGDLVIIPLEADTSRNFDPSTYIGFVSFYIGRVEDASGFSPTVEFGEEVLRFRFNGVTTWIYLSDHGNYSGNTPAKLKDVLGKQVICWYAPGYYQSNTLVGVTRDTFSSIGNEVEAETIDPYLELNHELIVDDSTPNDVKIKSSGAFASIILNPLGLTEDLSKTFYIDQDSQSVLVSGITYNPGESFNAFYSFESDSWTITKLGSVVIDDYSDITVNKKVEFISWMKYTGESNERLAITPDPWNIVNAGDNIAARTTNALFLGKQGVYKVLNKVTVGSLEHLLVNLIAPYNILNTIRVKNGSENGHFISTFNGNQLSSFQLVPLITPSQFSTKQDRDVPSLPTTDKTIEGAIAEIHERVQELAQVFIPKGSFLADFDYTTITGLTAGWLYRIKDSTGNGIKDINFPSKVFYDGEEVYWVDATEGWDSMGNADEWNNKIDKVTGQGYHIPMFNLEGGLNATSWLYSKASGLNWEQDNLHLNNINGASFVGLRAQVNDSLESQYSEVGFYDLNPIGDNFMRFDRWKSKLNGDQSDKMVFALAGEEFFEAGKTIEDGGYVSQAWLNLSGLQGQDLLYSERNDNEEGYFKLADWNGDGIISVDSTRTRKIKSYSDNFRIELDDNYLAMVNPDGNEAFRLDATNTANQMNDPYGMEGLYLQEYWTALRVSGDDLVTGQRYWPNWEDNEVKIFRPGANEVLAQTRYETRLSDSNGSFIILDDLLNGNRVLYNQLADEKIDISEQLMFLNLVEVIDTGLVTALYVKNSAGEVEELLPEDLRHIIIFEDTTNLVDKSIPLDMSTTSTAITMTGQGNVIDGYIREDGLKLYTLTTDGLNEYDLTTPRDITTRVFVRQNTAFSSYYGMVFSPNGDKVYMWRNPSGVIHIYEFTLSEAWNISAASLSYNMTSAYTKDANESNLQISSDGKALFCMQGTSTAKGILKVSLTEAYNLSTKFQEEVFQVYSGPTYVYVDALFISTEEKFAYFVKQTGITITEILVFTFGTPGDISTLTQIGTISLGDANPSMMSSEGGFHDMANGTLYIRPGTDHYQLLKYSFTPIETLLPVVSKLQGNVRTDSNGKMIIEQEADEIERVIDYSSRVQSVGLAQTSVPAFTYNSLTQTISIGEALVALRSDTDHVQPIKLYNVPATTSLDASGINLLEAYLCVYYNSGSPIYTIETDRFNISGSDKFVLYSLWRVGDYIHSADQDSMGLGLSNKSNLASLLTKRYRLVEGTTLTPSELTTPVNRTIAVIGAKVAIGNKINEILAFNSSVDSFTRVHRDVDGITWVFTPSTYYSNDVYNPITGGLVALGNNKYTYGLLYRAIGDVKEVFWVLGIGEYNSITEARLASEIEIPNLPEVVKGHSLLVGRFIIQKDEASGIVEPWRQEGGFFTTAIPNHNDLANIQGGTPGDYQHLTTAQVTKINGIEEGAEVNPTAAEIKSLYESNLDTNALTDALLAILNKAYTKDSSLLPSTTEAYDLGSALYRFRDLYLSGSTIYIGNDISIRRNADGSVGFWNADGSVAIDVKSGNNALLIESTLSTYLINNNFVSDSNYVHTDENFTLAEKSKLAGLESSKYLGTYSTLIALQTAHPSPTAGSYGDVDTGVGSNVIRYIWDNGDLEYVAQLGESNAETAASIKSKYESNPDTNAFTDTYKSNVDSNTSARHTHTNKSVLDLVEEAYTTAEKSKLSNIEANADVTDAANVSAAGAVMKTGDETINGVKTFGSFPVLPSSSPTSDYQSATKKYVDDNIPSTSTKDYIEAYVNLSTIDIGDYNIGPYKMSLTQAVDESSNNIKSGTTLSIDANGRIITSKTSLTKYRVTMQWIMGRGSSSTNLWGYLRKYNTTKYSGNTPANYRVEAKTTCRPSSTNVWEAMAIICKEILLDNTDSIEMSINDTLSSVYTCGIDPLGCRIRVEEV